ncbi:MAG: plasmid pRiA4b ORF-3 family protein [Gemmatimonadales bacterium]|nr:plasmid pRiA4b ORF-3 family protein [Gemmatimonadales bacterium]
MGFSARPRIRFGDGDVYQLRIELEGILPTVWRRVAVSGRASLRELHEIIQRAFDGDETVDFGYHFLVDGVEYLDPDSEPLHGHEADAIALEQLGLHPGARLEHAVEQFGDAWRHVVSVEQVTPRLVGQRLPSCLGAGRASPPEHCSGVAEYRILLEALRDPHDTRARDWLPEDFDPAYVDVVAINAALARLKRHRPAA